MMTERSDVEARRADELSNCSFVRTVLMLIVVLYHAMLCWDGKWFSAVTVEPEPVFAALTSWLNRFHIYGFVLVSGYVFHFTQYERGRKQSLASLMRSKARRLLIPYAFVLLAWVIPHQVYFMHPGSVQLIRDYLLAESPCQLWFLWMLVIVFAFYGVLGDFLRKHDAAGLLAVGAMYGVGLVGGKLLPNVFQIWTGCRYILYFWLGFKLRQHGTQRLRKIPALCWLALHVGLFLLWQHVPQKGGILISLINIGMPILINVVGAVMAFMVLQWLAGMLRWQGSRAFGCLQRYAMPVYLFHQQVVYWLIWLLNGKLPSGVHLLVNFAGALVISMAISWVLMRFRPTRTLIGEK